MYQTRLEAVIFWEWQCTMFDAGALNKNLFFMHVLTGHQVFLLQFLRNIEIGLTSKDKYSWRDLTQRLLLCLLLSQKHTLIFLSHFTHSHNTYHTLRNTTWKIHFHTNIKYMLILCSTVQQTCVKHACVWYVFIWIRNIAPFPPCSLYLEYVSLFKAEQ